MIKSEATEVSRILGGYQSTFEVFEILIGQFERDRKQKVVKTARMTDIAPYMVHFLSEAFERATREVRNDLRICAKTDRETARRLDDKYVALESQLDDLKRSLQSK